MFGLGTALLGAILCGSAVKAGWDNMQCMSKPTDHLKDGTPVYRDRTGNTYINGEKTYQDWYSDEYGHSHWTVVGEKTKKTYYDTYDSKCRIDDEYDKRDKQKRMEQGYTSYLKHHPQFTQPVTTEMSTGKIIAKLEGLEDGTYWKYYLAPNASIPREEDEHPTQITQEEYDKLNILDGTHFAADIYRNYYKMVNGKLVLCPKDKNYEMWKETKRQLGFKY